MILPTILHHTTEIFGIRQRDIMSERRQQDIVRARHAAMYAMRELTGYSLPQIGRAFKRDHTTIIHACRRVEDIAIRNEDYRSKVNALVEVCRPVAENDDAIDPIDGEVRMIAAAIRNAIRKDPLAAMAKFQELFSPRSRPSTDPSRTTGTAVQEGR